MKTETGGYELTARALITGMVIGALLTPCNVYSGLKIGWSFNMSIASALLSVAFWRLAGRLTGGRSWDILECNINQTTASAAASIISGGLVAPIPALTLLTGRQLPWASLSLWVFSVSALGIVVAVVMRRSALQTAHLTFPAGVATAETVLEIFGHGLEAVARVKVLLGAAIASAAVKLTDALLFRLPRPFLPFSLPGSGSLAATGLPLKSLGFQLDPSLLMIGFGAIIGLRAGLSLLLGALLAWLWLGPWAIHHGYIPAAKLVPGAVWFGPMVEWLLWPGVTLMVVASLASFGLTVFGWRKTRRKAQAAAATPPAPSAAVRPHPAFIAFAVGCMVLVVFTQVHYFGIELFPALMAVPVSLVLAVVATRVVGETGIPPIGALGKVSQLSFGVIAPANVTANLMTANVAGGTAGQCADLLNDLKTGALLRATPGAQIIAQVFGVITGSLVGSATYLALIPDPAGMLLTAKWPAPAVATWKAVAETLQAGLSAIPNELRVAMLLAAFAGLGLAIAHRALPERWASWVPSAPAVGLAFVLPAWNSLSMCLGAVIAYGLGRLHPHWSRRFLLAAAAGLVAGESIAGVVATLAHLGH
jgi:putative OPT family oligopeptide transporter